MGDLRGMLEFLWSSNKDLNEIQDKLEKIQLSLNNNFSNVDKVRNDEMEFLQEKFFSDNENGKFPYEIKSIYTAKLIEEEKKFDDNLNKLRKEKEELKDKFVNAEKNRVKFFKNFRDSNVSLNNKEEQLEKKIKELEDDIADYNKTIDELNTGFGFLLNIFKMKKIQKKKENLIEKRDGIVVQIEDIRRKWQKSMKKYSKEEKSALNEWNDTQTEFSLVSEKVENLYKNRKLFIKKAAFISAIEELHGTEKFTIKNIDSGKPEYCKFCKSKNVSNMFFCKFCGARFKEDRPDIIGSLVEVGELNVVYKKLKEGMGGAVSFLALIKGVNLGVNEFIKSVDSVKESQDKYSALPNLIIDVPESSKSFAGKISELKPMIVVKDEAVHPEEYKKIFEEYSENVFTEKNIESFFTKMGDELNRTTEEQW